MNKVGAFSSLAIVAAIFVSSLPQSAFGRPQYRTRLAEVYQGSKIASAVNEAKCNACHYGTSKKNRNDFGLALSKHLTKEVFLELNKDKKALDERISQSLKAVLSEKSASGKTFGELIEAGRLPGTAPEEK
jgi:hypothetical protein